MLGAFKCKRKNETVFICTEPIIPLGDTKTFEKLREEMVDPLVRVYHSNHNKIGLLGNSLQALPEYYTAESTGQTRGREAVKQ